MSQIFDEKIRERFLKIAQIVFLPLNFFGPFPETTNNIHPTVKIFASASSSIRILNLKIFLKIKLYHFKITINLFVIFILQKVLSK